MNAWLQSPPAAYWVGSMPPNPAVITRRSRCAPVYDWKALTDAEYAALPQPEPMCNFEQIHMVADYLVAAGNM